MSIGIYRLTNTINGKKYIGQSWNIEKRFIEHKACKLKYHLYRAISKYGWDNFKCEIVKTLSNSKLSQILLDIYEKKYIEEENTTDSNIGYNKQYGGANGLLCEEIKEKQSESAKKYWQSMDIEKRKERAKTNKGKTGFVESIETRIKKSKSHIGMKHTEESKKKISETKLRKNKEKK